MHDSCLCRPFLSCRLGLKHEITDSGCDRDERSCISFSNTISDAYYVCAGSLCSCCCRMGLQLRVVVCDVPAQTPVAACRRPRA